MANNEVENQATDGKTAFHYESFEAKMDYLAAVQEEEGKTIRMSIIGSIPGMEYSVISNREHWWNELEDKNKFITCHNGSCCTTYTHDNFNSGTKTQMKAMTSYYVPVVTYDKGKDGFTDVAVVKKLRLNGTNYRRLVTNVNSCEEGTIPFFERDIQATFTKENKKKVWDFIKLETKARWLSDPTMKAAVDEQLLEYPQKLAASLPRKFTEADFLIEKEKCDARLAAKLKEVAAEQQTIPGFYQPQQPQQPQMQQVPNIAPLAQSQQPYAAPVQTEVETQPIVAQPVQAAPQPVPMPTAPQPVAPQPVQAVPQATPVAPQPIQAVPQPVPMPAVQPVPVATQPQPTQPQPVVEKVDTAALEMTFDPASILK